MLSHRINPILPVQIPNTDLILCGCEDCTQERQQWTDNQPPLLASLDPHDEEDSLDELWVDIGGEG